MAPMKIQTAAPPWTRVVVIVLGLGVISLPAWELWRGVWPPNLFSPFFLLIILGACTVGVPAILGGLTGWADTWTIASGRIEIERRNPFTTRRLVFLPADIGAIEVVEHQAMEGENTFGVVLATTWGDRYDTPRRLSTRKFAEELLEEIRHAFRE
jgi:hypothetical protein